MLTRDRSRSNTAGTRGAHGIHPHASLRASFARHETGKTLSCSHNVREIGGGEQDEESPASLKHVRELIVPLLGVLEEHRAYPAEEHEVEEDQQPDLRHRSEDMPGAQASKQKR